MAERHGWLVAADFGSLAAELAVSRAVAGLADVSSIAKFELRGEEHALAADPSLGALARLAARVRACDGWWLPLAPELLLVLGVPGAKASLRAELEERAAAARRLR